MLMPCDCFFCGFYSGKPICAYRYGVKNKSIIPLILSFFVELRQFKFFIVFRRMLSHPMSSFLSPTFPACLIDLNFLILFIGVCQVGVGGFVFGSWVIIHGEIIIFVTCLMKLSVLIIVLIRILTRDIMNV